MGLAVGSIIEATFRGTLLGQTVMSVWHYAVTTVATEPSIANELRDFLNTWDNALVAGIRLGYVDCMPSNYTLRQSSAQLVSPTRSRKFFHTLNIGGNRTAAMVPNTAGVMTYQTDAGGRDQVGSKHLPIDPNVDAVDGNLDVAYKNVLAILGARTTLPLLVVANGGEYAPVLWHRKKPQPSSSAIKDFIVQDTARVMRRRTVGLGI